MRPPTRQQLVENRADRVDVRALIEILAHRLLGRHVDRRAEDLARLRERQWHRRHPVRAIVGLGLGTREIFGEPPVDDDGLAEVTDEDIRRLEIAVDDLFAVRVRHRIGDGDHVRQ